MSTTDIELLERWRNEDQHAGGELLTRHFNGLRIYFATRLPEFETSDLIQEVFVRMIDARDRFAGLSSVRTYIFHIARHLYWEKLRELHRPGGVFDPDVDRLADLSGRSQTSIIRQDQAEELMLTALEYLPSTQHDLLEFHYFQQMSCAELGELFAIPVGTVKSRLVSARVSLLREFISHLGPDADSWTEDALDRGLVQVGKAMRSESPSLRLRPKPKPKPKPELH